MMIMAMVTGLKFKHQLVHSSSRTTKMLLQKCTKIHSKYSVRAMKNQIVYLCICITVKKLFLLSKNTVPRNTGNIKEVKNKQESFTKSGK